MTKFVATIITSWMQTKLINSMTSNKAAMTIVVVKTDITFQLDSLIFQNQN